MEFSSKSSGCGHYTMTDGIMQGENTKIREFLRIEKCNLQACLTRFIGQ